MSTLCLLCVGQEQEQHGDSKLFTENTKFLEDMQGFWTLRNMALKTHEELKLPQIWVPQIFRWLECIIYLK
jgi:hypothetical protein